LTATSLESSVLDNIPGQILHLPTGEMLPMTTPELRRSSGKYLTLRGLRLTNAIIRKGILQVAGSPWLPGFWNLSAEKAEVALQSLSGTGRHMYVVFVVYGCPREFQRMAQLQG
jgi:hypothetical protein